MASMSLQLSEEVLNAAYAARTAPNIKGSATDRAHFDYVDGSGLLAGFTSRHIDANGAPVTGGVVMKDSTDASEGVIDWSHNGTSGYLIHFTAATGMTGDGLIGVGISPDVPVPVTGIVTSQKGIGIGLGPNNMSTAKWTGNGDTATGYAVKGTNLGGVWLRADMGNSGYSSGHLIELHGYTGSTNEARLITFRDQADNEHGYFDAADMSLHLMQGTATPTNDHEVNWQLGSGVAQNMYVYTGSNSFWASRVQATSNKLVLAVAQAAAKGSETYKTAFSATAFGSGAGVALYGGTPVAQPARKGQLTDNSGGTSGGNTIAAVAAATTTATSADLATTKNAIATLAAKVNALEAVLSAAGGGIGVTA